MTAFQAHPATTAEIYSAYESLIHLPEQTPLSEAKQAVQNIDYQTYTKIIEQLTPAHRAALQKQIDRLSAKTQTITIDEVLLSSQAGQQTAALPYIISGALAVALVWGFSEIFACSALTAKQCPLNDRKCRVDAGRDCQKAMQFGYDLPGNTGRYRDGTLGDR